MGEKVKTYKIAHRPHVLLCPTGGDSKIVLNASVGVGRAQLGFAGNRRSDTLPMIRPIVKWFGGKYYLAPKIIALFPPHQVYVEPFGGAASVLLNKPPSPVEVYNDLDGRIVRLFRVLRDQPQEFQRRLALTPYAEMEWQQAVCQPPPEDEIEAARRDFVRWRMSLAGRGESFSYSLQRTRRGMADVVSGFLSAIDEVLPQIVERFRRVQILCRDALEVIDRWDSPKTLFYCDPPYHPQTVQYPQSYLHSYSEQDHERLLDRLCRCRAKVVLSGYACPLYEQKLSHWRCFRFSIANHASTRRKKQYQQEMVWCNW